MHVKCRATIGQLGNVDHNLIRIGKAGKSRHMGWRPYVRGTAMNPIDHPMGGGEGRTKGGRHPVSETGVLSKGGKTRQPRNFQQFHYPQAHEDKGRDSLWDVRQKKGRSSTRNSSRGHAQKDTGDREPVKT